MPKLNLSVLLVIFTIFIHSSTFIETKPTKKQEITRYPVVLIPGDGGNQLHAKLNKTITPHYICQKHSSSYFELWLNLEEITPFVIDCFVDNMRLVSGSASSFGF
jgi:nicotinamidase-related amidase